MPSALGRGIDLALDNLDMRLELPLPTNVPLDPEEFYKDFGYLKHPVTRQPVTRLADYQYDTWRKFLQHGRLLEVKSHRVGESSKWMLVDFQLAILPTKYQISTRGFDTMLLAPTKPQAIEVLRDFRRRAIESKKYSAFVMDKPTEIDLNELTSKSVLRDEQSKTQVLYIKNPEDPIRPSRIIALGAEHPGSLESLPNFKHLHITDITSTRGDYREAFNIALTRIGNSDGTCVIETIPGRPIGPIFDMAQKLRGSTDPVKGDFLYTEVTAEQAIAAGVMSRDFLESERRRLTEPEFNALYMAQFDSVTGNVFSSAVIEKAIELGKLYDPEKISPDYEKSQGIDQGFGSSNFGICVVQLVDNILQVVMADEHERPDIDVEINSAATRIRTWGIHSTQCDAAQPAFIASLKRKIGENANYENLPKERFSYMRVKPIAFGTSGRSMLGNAVILLEKGRVAIHPKFEKLLTSLRTAIAEDYALDKEKTVHDDVLDAFRLALEPYSLGGKK